MQVRDTGGGIRRDQQAQVFEPFFTTEESSSGSGLGLATIHGNSRQNRGHVTVASKVGEGATFRVFLARTRDRTEAPVLIHGAAQVESLAIDGDERFIHGAIVTQRTVAPFQ